MKYRFLSILFLYHVFLKCDHKFLSSISRIFLKVTQQANFFLTSQFFQTLKMHIWTPLVVQWNVHFHCRRTQVQSLTEESRSHMLHSAGKKKKHLKILAAYSFLLNMVICTWKIISTSQTKLYQWEHVLLTTIKLSRSS